MGEETAIDELKNTLYNVRNADFKKCTTEALERTAHRLHLGNSETNQKVINSIKMELDKRYNEKALFWQKWGVILSVSVSIVALIISGIAYLKP